ncbi:Methyltransferase FkbM family (fragment) [Candidatus Terasakiella magnetica]
MNLDEYEQIQPVANITLEGVELAFSVPTTKVLWRVQTLQSKEPWTYQWVMSMTEADILVDVGANIGLFSILASRIKGVRTFSFEPEAQNYALLTRNIIINGLCERVTAYCAAVTDRLRLDRMYLTALEPGGSCHQFAENVDFNLQPVNHVISQGCVGISLDDVIASGQIVQPSHLKVDVDGFEHLVLAGAPRTLASPVLRSIQMEVNLAIPEHKDMLTQLEAQGFRYDPAQMEAASHAAYGHNNHYDVIFNRA